MCVVGISSFAVPSVLSSAIDAFRGKAALLLPQYCPAISLLIALLSLLEQERLCAAPLVGLQCFLRSAFIGLSWKGEKFHFMGGCKIVGWKCF